MRRVTGLPDDQVVAWESKLEAQVVASLQAVMDKIASRIERVLVASGLSNVERGERVVTGRTLLGCNDSCSPDRPQWTLVAVATTGPTGDDDPPPMTGELAIPEPTPLPAVLPETPGLPPGQSYISPDDLASITPLWQQQVVDQVLPLVAQVFVDAAGHVRSQFLDAVAPGVRLGLPGLGSVAAEAYLAQARNTYQQVGDHLWATARAQLSQGFESGESIPQLAARLRQSAGLSARTAVMVARTSVIEASNAGSMAMARVSGLEMLKEWIATPDLRTRPTHLAADGQRVALSEPFIVGGYSADFPAAPTLPPSERYRCRCTQGYVMPDRQPVAQPQLPGTSAPPAIEAPPEPVVGEVFPKTPGEPGFDLADFPEPPPVKVRSSLLRARTDRELIAAWQGEMRAITGRDIIVQLPPDASVLTMREHAEGVLQMLERFPEARLRKISWYDTASTEYAHVKVGTATLEFNARWASTAMRRDYLASLRHDVSGWDDAAGPGYGWSVRGGRVPQATSWHEMAHILSIETLGGKLKAEAMRITLRRQVADALPDMESIVRRDVSGYATKNMEELIAEAMTDVMANGPRASLLSRELYDMVAREYRAKGFAVRTVDVPEGEAGFESFTREAFPKAAGPRGVADHIDRIVDIPAAIPGQLRARVKAELQRQADLNSKAVEDLLGVHVATEAQWREMFAAGMDPWAGYVRNQGHIYFSPRWRTARKNIEGVVRRAYENDELAWSFPGYDQKNLDVAAGVLRHELGHEIAVRFPFQQTGDPWPDVWRRRLLDPLAEELGVARPGADVEAWYRSPAVAAAIRRKISVRATDEFDEMFAEIWAVYSGRGAEASALAQRIGGVMHEAWRGIGDARLPPVARAPRALTSQTVAQLRALAKERGITVPAGTRKADLVRLLDKGAAPTPISGAALPARVVAARAELDRVANSPLVGEPRRMGGDSAYTFRERHESGDVITKDTTRSTTGKAEAKRDADAEELGALVGDSLDLRVPAVVRTGPSTLRMEFIEGTEGGGQWRPGLPDFEDTDDGKLLGLLDILTGNPDRSGDNWLILPGGRIASIDMGSAFRAPKMTGAQHAFGARLQKASFDIAPADLALIRTRLEALRPEFERLKRGTWHKQMMARLAEVEKRATGTRSRLGVAVDDVRRSTGPLTGRAALDSAPIDLSEVRRVPGVSAAQRKAIEAYGNDAQRINDQIRRDEMSTRVALNVRRIDEVLERSALPVDVETWRGLRSGRLIFGEENPTRDLGGFEWDEKAFVSTTADDRVAAQFAGSFGDPAPIIMRVLTPSGTRAIKLSDLGSRGAYADQAELLLQRGLRMRVVRDHGLSDYPGIRSPVRRLDVEIIPASPFSPEATAVARQAVIDERRAVADSLGEVRELLANGASERALASRARLIAGRTTGAASEDLAGVVRAMESGDADRIRVALGDVAQRRGLTEVGPGGDVVPFDPKVHELVGGARRPPAGTFVQVQRPGYSVRLDDGEVVQLSKAKVDTLTVEEIAERTAAQERKALREAARERNRVIEAQRGTARLLAEVDELAAKGASKTAIRERLDPALREAGQAYAGADAAVVDTLSAALDSGDLTKIRAAVTRAGTKAKIKPIGRAGAKTTFDPDTMEGVGGIDIAPGAKVTVVRRGSTVPGLTDPLAKAQVTPIAARGSLDRRGGIESPEPRSRAVAALPRQAGRPETPTVAARTTNPRYGDTQGVDGAPTYRDAGRAGQRYTPDMGPLPSGAYEENCSNAVIAFEMRMRGFDVVAAPLDVLDKYGYAGGRTFKEMDELMADAWRLPGGKAHGRTWAGQEWRSFAQWDEEILRDWPDGGRGFMTVGKHIFNVTKANGKVQYVEAQFNASATRIVTTQYRRKYGSPGIFEGGPQEVKVIRTDDLEPADGILQSVEPRK